MIGIIVKYFNICCTGRFISKERATIDTIPHFKVNRCTVKFEGRTTPCYSVLTLIYVWLICHCAKTAYFRCRSCSIGILFDIGAVDITVV